MEEIWPLEASGLTTRPPDEPGQVDPIGVLYILEEQDAVEPLIVVMAKPEHLREIANMIRELKEVGHDLSDEHFLDLHDNNFNAIHIPPLHGYYSSNQRSHNMSNITLHNSTNFSNLRFLDLSYNFDLQIDDLRWVSQLSFLNNLDLSYADLSEETHWLQRIIMSPSLVELRLSYCFLNDIQPHLGYVNFTSLEVLDISDNDFLPEVPKWLFNLSNSIYSLDLSFNNFRGQVPKEMSNFQHLKSLLLGHNNFNGSIPDWVGEYKELEHLDLSCNSFSGPIPETPGNLSSLAYMDVGHNKLSGSLPKSLGIYFSVLMSNCDGEYNEVEGFRNESIPKDIGSMQNLESLDLSVNQLSGEIPQSMVRLYFLAVLNLSYNNMSGEIPIRNQFSTFDNSSYSGNPYFCGGPLQKSCSSSFNLSNSQDELPNNSQDEIPNEKKQHSKKGSDDEFAKWFHVGVAIGFAYGFWGACLVLFFVPRWTHAFLRFLSNMNDRIYVFTVLNDLEGLWDP
ncbi:receptor-like protein EIX2 [Prosopis cineraria]|uniref:receptor-like protein EIX2 n=1 Tax=Prosopis cineraria TaxID=364024 RepID=UPI00240F53F9|nr:receptor-like protein EIX2 [Prosopis cineraria]